MSALSKAQQDVLIIQLDDLFSTLYLRCDGYLVKANMVRIKYRLVVMVAVNGWEFKGEWLPRDGRAMSEEARRFWRPVKKVRLSKKQLARAELILGKRECKKHGYYDPYILPTPEWLSPRAFIRHVVKHNAEIEVLEYGEYKSALALRESLGKVVSDD